MSGFLDTSFVVRYLTADSPALAERAARVLDGQGELVLTDVVLVETAYVLTSVYRIPREVVVDGLVALVQKENLSVFGMEKGPVLQALLMCRSSGRVSFADAMLWAAARSAGAEAVYSFDERFPVDAVEIRRG